MKTWKILAAVVLMGACSAWAAEEKMTVVLGGLSNPCGIAVQPETGDLFISDSAAGKVIRFHDDHTDDVIVGFPQDVYGKGPKYDIGPLGLAFIDKNTLVVGGGGLPDGEELLRVYKIPDDHKADPIKADDMHAKLGPLAAEDDLKGEGNFYAIAVIGDSKSGAIYVTSNGDDNKGWVTRATYKDGEFGGYERYLATKEAVNVDAPVGITQHKKGYLVVGQMGEITKPKDSLLTMYNPKDKKLLMNLETGLFDITSIAYSPKGHMYALDFAWMDTTEGGLFRLDEAKGDDGEQTVNAVKIIGLDKPTAMAFGADKALYITVIGTAEEAAEGEDAKPAGKLIKLEPGL